MTNPPQAGDAASRAAISSYPEPQIPPVLLSYPVSLQATDEKPALVARALARITGLDVSMPNTEGVRLTLNHPDSTLGQVVESITAATRWVVHYNPPSLRFIEGEAPAALAVASTGWYDPQTIAEALGQALGEDASTRPLAAGVLVQGDDATLRRLATVEQVLDASRPAAWEFSMWVVAVSGDTRRTLEAIASARGLARIDIGDPWESLLQGVLQADFAVEGGSSEVQALSTGTVVVVEGEKARWQAGERVPIPRRTISPQGTVSVSGYDSVDVGYICELAVRRNPEGITVSVKPEISSIIGFVEDAPRVATRSIESVAYLRDGSYLVVSGLDEWRVQTSTPFVGVGGRSSESGSRVLFILRAKLLP